MDRFFRALFFWNFFRHDLSHSSDPTLMPFGIWDEDEESDPDQDDDLYDDFDDDDDPSNEDDWNTDNH
jgi:hypothetical protein